MAKQSKAQKASTKVRRKTAVEIYRALEPLTQKAESAGLTFLAYLLAIAARHIEDEIVQMEEDNSGQADKDQTGDVG